jgi:hypothetical protein
MTASNIPDGISFSDLQALAATARDEEQKQKESTDEMTICDMSPKEFDTAVKAALAEINDNFSHPMTAKLQALEAIAQLMHWHTDKGQREFADGDIECGTAWLRDAGKLQTCMSTLVEVMLPDDYIHQHEMNAQCRRFTQGE